MSTTPLESAKVAAPVLSDSKRRLLQQRLSSRPAVPRQTQSIQPRQPGSLVPVTPQQYSIWLDCTLQPDLPTYNEAVTLSFGCNIDRTTLELALNAFIARHEIWRTTFFIANGEVLQHVYPSLSVNLAFADLSHLPELERRDASLQLARDQALTPLDPAVLPLLRGTLVRLAPGDACLHLVLHHLIFDGFSLRRTFLPQLEELYKSFAAEAAPPLSRARLQYADFSAWQRRQLDSPAFRRHLDFWRTGLAGALPVSQLPLDRPRNPSSTHRGDVVRFTLSRDLTNGLRNTARAHGATLYMALLATLKAVLFRYSGRPDLVLGTVADGRNLPELESMMGYILNVFAVRTAPSSDLPFSRFLQQVKHSLLEAHEASFVPFERVVSAIQAQGQGEQARRDFSHAPIFQTLFAFQPAASSASSWSISNTEISLGISKFDLYVEADEQPSQTNVRIFFSTDLFDAATIQRLGGHWSTVIEGVINAPDTEIGDLPLLTPVERETMLTHWNNTAAPLPQQTVHGLFEEQARLSPASRAVTFEGTTLTYAQLEEQSSDLAHHLQKAGAVPGVLAAVLLDRSQYLAVALLAVLKTGAAYMPLDPGTPAARVALCLEDGQPAVILTSRARAPGLPPCSARMLVLEDILGPPTGVPYSSIQDPDALAYVIHTSGSTGLPKGVELCHRGVVNFLLSMQRRPGFSSADTIVALTTISFDIAVLELFLPLISGGHVVIAGRETALDPARLAGLVEKLHATMLQATPATWAALVASDWHPSRPLKALCGGEALNRSLADRLLAVHVDLWNVYGPTESTVWSTLHHVQPGTGTVSIGRPLANTSTYILDARLQPVPINIPGELYIGGAGLARGYRNQPGLTRERFIITPSGERLYRTGDYALFRADGLIECLGRADNQVKVRGYRMELEDVEVNLTAHPQVAFAAAKAWPEPEGGSFLCAYLVGVAGPPPDAAELRAFLRSRVADYMIPSEIVALSSLPLTANGKLDRAQLRQPERSAVDLTAHAVASFTPTEARLARIWADLLHVNRISAGDNFFDLGGHSLLLLKLVRLVQNEFSIDLPMTALFQAATLQKLAAGIDELIARLTLQLAAQLPPALISPEPSAAPALPSVPRMSPSVVRLNTLGTRRPFFLIHSLMLYGRLPAALGPDQPFYGLDTLPFDPLTHDSWVETMLEEHVAEIKRIQPTGPYQIGGWCFAGLMAYEVARRLEDRGERVSVLALLDSWNPCRPPGFKPGSRPGHNPSIEPGAESHSAQGVASASAGHPVTPPSGSVALTGSLATTIWKIRFRVRQIVALAPAQRSSYIRRMIRDHLKGVLIPLSRRAKSTLFRACKRLGFPLPSFLNDPWVVTFEWLGNYQVRSYSGDITLLRPAGLSVPPTSDPACGWQTFTSGEIRSCFIPGDRSTMFLTEGLAVLAAELRDLMDGDTL